MSETDITRTIAIGDPGPEARECYTRVLQGMIAISRVRWPRGVAGRDLDALARFNLWTAGQDFDHGTGHGVGAFLSVHEGPQRISRVSEVPLEPGMILNVPPGRAVSVVNPPTVSEHKDYAQTVLRAIATGLGSTVTSRKPARSARASIRRTSVASSIWPARCSRWPW